MMQWIKKEWQKIFIKISLLILPMVSFAQGTVPAPACLPGQICNPLAGRIDSIPELINTILENLLKLGIPLFAVALIFSGLRLVMAMGNQEKLSKAKTGFLVTLGGGAVFVGSVTIAKVIVNTVTALG